MAGSIGGAGGASGGLGSIGSIASIGSSMSDATSFVASTDAGSQSDAGAGSATAAAANASVDTGFDASAYDPAWGADILGGATMKSDIASSMAAVAAPCEDVCSQVAATYAAFSM